MKTDSLKHAVLKAASKQRLKTLASLCLLASTASHVQAVERTLAPPPVMSVDRHSVNMMSGEVQFSLTDLSIGGERGLAHTISSSGGNFVNLRASPRAWGFMDNFRGGIYTARHSNPNQYGDLDDESAFYVLRAFGDSSTVDFRVNPDGTYQAIQELNNDLEYRENYGYVMTKADGTELHFPSQTKLTATRSNIERSFNARLAKIVYTNGFTIDIHAKDNRSGSPIYSVNTNTGFQLKYEFAEVARPLIPPTEDYQYLNPCIQIEGHEDRVSPTRFSESSTLYNNMASWSSDWAEAVPISITALNNAVESCPTDAQSCSLSSEWPAATYYYPGGMPQAAFKGRSLFSITDAGGRVTEFHHQGFWDNTGYPSTKIVAVKDANSQAITQQYSYDFPIHQFATSIRIDWQARGEAILSSAQSMTDTRDYNCYEMNIPDPTSNTDFYSPDFGYNSFLFNQTRFVKGHINFKPISLVRKMYHGLNDRIEAWDKIIYFNKAYSVAAVSSGEADTDPKPEVLRVINDVSLVQNLLGKTEQHYLYNRNTSNLTGILEDTIVNGKVDHDIKTRQIAAQFDCDTDPRTYCHKTLWIEDKNGHKTHYTYHAPSGQVETVTSPPNQHGITHKIYFEYDQYYAHYKDASGVMKQADTPIWLLKAKYSCAKSQLATTTCSEGDLIKTTYEYDYHNLYRIGQAMEADGKTLRTCYQYDQYGNLIGEIPPKAQLTTCAL